MVLPDEAPPDDVHRQRRRSSPYKVERRIQGQEQRPQEPSDSHSVNGAHGGPSLFRHLQFLQKQGVFNWFYCTFPQGESVKNPLHRERNGALRQALVDFSVKNHYDIGNLAFQLRRACSRNGHGPGPLARRAPDPLCQ